nr:ABC transporter ATP-binding protein [Bdellovibrio sp. HM001]
MSSDQTSIILKNVSLTYDLHYDRTNSLKEAVINFLTKRQYVPRKKAQLNALCGVNATISLGERVGIIGLNGAGKSTLLKVISGILKPTAGEIIVNGNIQPLIEIGAGFDPEFTGRENIYLNSYMLGFTKDEVRQHEQEIIDFADLGTFIDTPIKYYSSGMAVRLAFSIATIIKPEILVFDEMLAAGDASFIDKAKKRIDDLINKAKVMVIVSHDLNLIKTTCTRCLLMEKGQVAFDGPPAEAIKRYLDSIKK